MHAVAKVAGRETGDGIGYYDGGGGGAESRGPGGDGGVDGGDGGGGAAAEGDYEVDLGMR